MSNSDQSNRRRLEGLEREARTRPRLHQARLTGLVLLGYGYPLALLAASFLLLVGVIAVAPLIIENISGGLGIVYLIALGLALALVYAVAKAFLASLPLPDMQKLAKEDAPALQAMIDEVGRASGSPPVDEVYIDMSVNAGVTQRPRWGIFGVRKSYLFVGLPLLAGLTPEQFRVVLAHEFAHLRGRHTSFGAWMVRLEHTWQSLAIPVAAGSKARRLLALPFVRWYSRKLTLNSLPLRRVYEFEADTRAAEMAGQASTADALAAVDWVGYRIGRGFWPLVLREASHNPLPPGDVVGRMSEYLSAEAPDESMRRWKEHERLARTPVTSDHPCLRERLEVLGSRLLKRDGTREDVARSIAPEQSARTLLGEGRPRVCGIANAIWKSRAIGRWRMEYALARQATKESEETRKNDTAIEGGDERSEAAWKHTQTEARYAPPEVAIALLRGFVVRFPEHGAANFELGEMLLQQDDEQAVGFLEAAATHDADYTAMALRMLLAYYREAGRDEEADPVRLRVEAHDRDLARARSERMKVGRKDRFAPHGLRSDDLDKVRRMLFRYPQVRTAWLARKQVSLFAEKPVYVLCVRRPANLFGDAKSDKHLAAAIQSEMHLPCAVVVYRRAPRSLRKRLLVSASEPVFDGSM